MIRINLLPQAEGKARAAGRRGAPAGPKGATSAGPMAAGILLVGCALGGYISIDTFSQVSKTRADARKAQNQKAALEKDVKSLSLQAGDIQEKLEVLTYQKEILESLDPPGRVLWSEKLSQLSELIPQDVFLIELDVTESIREIDNPKSVQKMKEWEEGGKKGTKPEIVRQPVITYTLTVRGLADGPSGTEQIENALKFHKALLDHRTKDNHKEDTGFMVGFRPEIDIRYIESTLYEKQYPVAEFEFILRTEPPAMKAETSEGAPTAPAKPAPKK